MKKITITLLMTSLLSVGYASTMKIYAEVSANIIKVQKVGTVVKRGETLVLLDDRQIKNKISEIEANLRYKKILVEEATRIFDEETELYENTISKIQAVDLAKVDLAKAKSKYEEQVAKLKYYKNEKLKYNIQAPMNCKILKILNPRNLTNIYNSKAILEIQSH